MRYEIVDPLKGPLLGLFSDKGGAEAVCAKLNEKICRKHKKAEEHEIKPLLCYVREVKDA
jgi:hypothetical protein